MPYLTDLRAGLRAILRAAAILPDASIHWQGTSFRPPEAGTWAKEDLMPVSAALSTFPAEGGQIREDHILQLTFFGPSGGGMKAVEALVSAAQVEFKPGTTVMAGAVPAVVEMAEIGNEVREKEWTGLPLSVKIFAHRVN